MVRAIKFDEKYSEPSKLYVIFQIDFAKSPTKKLFSNDHVITQSDSNCYQVLAPLMDVALPSANYAASEHICHVGRNLAFILPLSMDAPHVSLSESNDF